MRRLSITVLVVAVVGASSGVAKADTPMPPLDPVPEKVPPPQRKPPELQRTDRVRWYHAIAISGMAAAYTLSEFAFKDTFAPDECGWCDPPSFDRDVRDALLWDHPGRARALSNIGAYVLAPLATLGLLGISGGKYGSRRVFDDGFPVAEAAAAVTIVGQTIKFTFGRSRPFVRFGDPAAPHDADDNLSFFSGHASFTFALAVGAGMVAHRRHYKYEPLIWAGGLTVAASTAYLRIAGDKHYFTDVIVGAAAGSAFGFFVPRWLHDDVLGKDVNVIPTGKGIAIVGRF